MSRLALRFVTLTVVMVSSFVVFAEEVVVAALMLSTVFMATVALVLGGRGAEESVRRDGPRPAEDRIEPVIWRRG